MRNLGKANGRKPRTLDIVAIARRAEPEPEVLKLIGEDSERKGTDRLTSRQIDRVIDATRRRSRRLEP
jgi:hypothetical protein